MNYAVHYELRPPSTPTPKDPHDRRPRLPRPCPPRRGARRGPPRPPHSGGEGRPADAVLLLRPARHPGGLRRGPGGYALRATAVPRLPADGGQGDRRRPRRLAAVRPQRGTGQPPAAQDHRREPARHPGPLRVRRHPRPAHHVPRADRGRGQLGPRGGREGPADRGPRGARRRHPLDLRPDGGHRPRPALGPHHRGRRRGPLPGRRDGGRAGARDSRATAAPSRSSPGRSTSPATARPAAAATTRTRTSPTPSCTTSTSRPSRRPSTPAPRTS